MHPKLGQNEFEPNLAYISGDLQPAKKKQK